MVRVDFYMDNERSIELMQVDNKRFSVVCMNLKTGGQVSFKPMAYDKAKTCYNACIQVGRPV